MAVAISGLQAGSVFGNYRIEAPIGEGGMGAVYRATHLVLESTVALKVIKADSATNEESRQRFLRERKLAAKLRHPHIVHTTDAGEQDGQLFVVMDFVEGIDLQTMIDRGSLEPRRAAAVVNQVGSALDEAHRHDIIHRDVKPANILIETRDGEDWAYLTDFGLARLADGGMNVAMSFKSVSGQSVGTPVYMSPEQVQALKELDWRTDIWSLGVVLYAALAGTVPFMGDSI
jgi:serine/threonine protein kinase